jgi:arylsulfatase A-like enzyme
MGDHQMMLKGPIHYEALIRVPLVVRGPGFAPGAVVDDPVGTIDLAPTCLRACGVALPPQLEGRPLSAGAREHVLTEDDMIRGALAFRTLTTRRWRITRSETDPAAGELYDLAEDPGELVNRWSDAALAPVRSDLLATLDDVMRHDLGRVLPQVCQAG